MEETQYDALYSESVNNYMAIKPDRAIKAKGAYAQGGLDKNPTFPICTDAVAAYLIYGTEPAETITQCTDITRFVSVRRVAGGAVWKGASLGRVVRWYIGNQAENHPITYITNGNKVPKTDMAVPLMDLPESMPSDVHHDYYIHQAETMLRRLGVWA